MAHNIKERRRILGISQEKLAEKAGTSTHYIGQIELKNKFPSPEKLETIASALEIESYELFSVETMPSSVFSQFQDRILLKIENAVHDIINEERKEFLP